MDQRMMQSMTPRSETRARSPSMNSNLKSKIYGLERSLAVQDEIIEAQQRRITSLEIEKERSTADLEAQLVGLNEKFTKELLALKDDFEHRFALQLAENRRLQSQITSQKAEIGELRQKAQEVEHRLMACEAEIGE